MATGKGAKSNPALVIALCLCFFLSGATSLSLEVVWVRLFTQVFGSTNLAIATVLAIFMIGMALGSFLGGRIIDRQPPSRFLYGYAICEIGIAVSALAVPWFLSTFPGVNAWLWGSFGEAPLILAFVRALLCLLLLIAPTTFMGATLPILTKALVSGPEDFSRLGSRVSLLYAVNTAGAVVGAFASGFWLLPALGQSGLHWLAVAMAASIGTLAIAAARFWSQKELGEKDIKKATSEVEGREEQAPSDARKSAGKTTRSRQAQLALVAFGFSGAVAMALEGLFSRAIALILGSAIQSFTLVLVLFLLGLSLGAAVMGRFAERAKQPLLWLGFALVGASLAIIVVHAYLDTLPEFHHRLARSADVDLRGPAGVAIRALIAASIAPITFFLGAIMPLAIASYARSHEEVGGDVGRAYSTNTVGAVLGSLAGGFWLLPSFGLGGGILVCAFVLALVAIALTAGHRASKGLWIARALSLVAMISVFLVPRLDAKRMNAGMFAFLGSDMDEWGRFFDDNDLVYVRDGRASTIAVFESDGEFALLNNGKPDGSSARDVHTQILLGMLPAMLHPEEIKRSFVIGYGTGMTVGSLTQAPNVDKVEVVELEEAVYEAADKFFSRYTHAPEKNPNVQRFLGDGRNFLMYRGGSYDLIVSEPPDIWVAGVASLFSHEFYESVAAHLEDKGIFCQWVPLYHLSPSTIRMVYRTLLETFGYVQVFVLHNGNSIVIASQSPLSVRMEVLQERMRDSKASLELRRADVRFPAELVALLHLGERDVREFSGEGPIHTDDSGALEFAAQKDYFFSVRKPSNSKVLKDALDEEFAKYGNLSQLRIELGQGSDAEGVREGIRNVLLRQGRQEQAQRWQEFTAEAVQSRK